MRDAGATLWTADGISLPEWPGSRIIHQLKNIFIVFTVYYSVLPGGGMAWRLEQWRPLVSSTAVWDVTQRSPNAWQVQKRLRRRLVKGKLTGSDDRRLYIFVGFRWRDVWVQALRILFMCFVFLVSISSITCPLQRCWKTKRSTSLPWGDWLVPSRLTERS